MLIAFADCVRRLGISSSLSHKVFGSSQLDHISVVYHRGDDVTYLDFRRLITVNPLIGKIILDKLTFTKAKKVLNAPAFSAVPFLCALFVLMINHLFLKARIKLA